MVSREQYRIGALAALLAFAGCAPAAHMPAPSVVVPPSYPMEDRDLPGNAARIGWQAFFPDSELQSLIGRALANNRDLRAAAARIAQAGAALRARGADLAPQASGSLGAARIGVPDALVPLLRDDTLTSYNGLLQASWEIDLFGRLRSLRAAALEQYLASAEARRAVATSLVAQVVSGYLADREFAERLTLAREALVNRERSVALLSQRYRIGSGSRIEITQAETLRTQAAGEIEALELARAQNLNALAVLVGEPLSPAEFHHNLGGVGLDQPIAAGLPSELIINRPDIAAAEHQLRRANANIAAARAAFLPSVSLTGVVGATSDDFDNLFAKGTGLWLFRPNITLPIFTAGKLRANLRGTEAQRDELLASYEKTIQSAFRDVADALAQRRWLAAQIVTVDQSVAALTERSRLSRVRYDAGRTAYLDVLDAERDRFSAEQKRVQLRRAWLASGVALYAALGGGFPEPESKGAIR